MGADGARTRGLQRTPGRDFDPRVAARAAEAVAAAEGSDDDDDADDDEADDNEADDDEADGEDASPSSAELKLKVALPLARTRTRRGAAPPPGPLSTVRSDRTPARRTPALARVVAHALALAAVATYLTSFCMLSFMFTPLFCLSSSPLFLVCAWFKG